MEVVMTTRILAIIGLIACGSAALADCALTHFPWGCDLPAHTTTRDYVSSLIYCRNTPLYVTEAEYDLLIRYQGANVSMNVTLNGEFVEGPCIPGQR